MDSFQRIAQPGRLTLGLVFPIEAYSGAVPSMENQETLAQRAEELGFKALWFRDVPFHDPTFGDVGQMYDPWVYMTHILNHTRDIALATGSIILPLRHPVHTAKSLFSLQRLSKGRVIMGIASGDRPIEYPAFGQDLAKRGELFRDSFAYLKALHEDFPRYQSPHYGEMLGNIDLLPKSAHKTPMLVTGHAGQSLEWIAEHADGWLYYPRDPQSLPHIMTRWQDALQQTHQPWKPYMQSLYIDLVEEKRRNPTPIHLGFKSGTDYVIAFLKWLESVGVNHVIINLKYGSRPAEVVLEELGEAVLPQFAGEQVQEQQ